VKKKHKCPDHATEAKEIIMPTQAFMEVTDKESKHATKSLEGQINIG
jgi:hypothetical protein